MATLLAVLDGIEGKKEIVTIATTNCLETLDKALNQRPARFDRVIRLSRPSLEQRRELVSRLCNKIPFDEARRNYLTHKTDGCTPAQIQEVIYSLIIEQAEVEHSPIMFDARDIDHAISRINGRNGHRTGFLPSSNHNGNKSCHADTIRLD